MSSALGRAAVPIRTDTDAMPWLARFQHAPGEAGWYVVRDPDGKYEITDSGDVTYRAGRHWSRFTTLAIAAAVTAWLAAAGTSRAEILVNSLIGLVVGLVLGAVSGKLARTLAAGVQTSRDRRAGRTASATVAPANEQGWRLCLAAVRVSRTDAWTDRTIDPHRNLPRIIWAAIDRSVNLDWQQSDARQALGHESLVPLAEDTLDRVARERESLQQVEANIDAVGRAARAVDRQRAERDWSERVAHERGREERELLGRLTGVEAARTTGTASDDPADRAAGLAAEAREVARLLAETERILRGMG